MAHVTCPHCGAPWRPDVTGACRFCRATGEQLDASLDQAGLEGLLGRLLQAGIDAGHPLDPLARTLEPALGSTVSAERDRAGRVRRFQVDGGDWRLILEQPDPGAGRRAPAGMGVHEVRGIVLKREDLTPDEWVQRAAAVLAALSGRDSSVRSALVDADRSGRP
jgi:hypothetical protein